MRNWLLIACLLFQVAAPAPRDGGTLSGQIRSADGRPLSGISVMIVAGELRDGRPNLVPLGISIPGTLAQTDVAGRYHLENIPPGRYYILARPSSSANGDAATLYPGVTRLENAGKVEIRPGSKIDAIDFTIGQTTVVRVRGRVFNAIAGMPSRSATVNLTGGLLASFRTTVDANGLFQFAGVPPGEYVIWSSDNSAGPNRLFTTRRLTVPDRDVDDIELAFTPPLTVSGHFVLEEGATFPNPGMTPGVTANIVEGTLGTGTTALMDGSFELGGRAGLVEGEYRITVDHLPGDLYVKSIAFGSADLLRETLKVSGPPSSEIAITLGVGTRIQGRVFDENQQPASNVPVYVVPAVRQNDLIRIQQADRNGTFDIRGLAPGDYTVFAVAQPYAGQDPEFVRQYERLGTPVTVSRDAHPAVNLSLLR